jgi:hypothetical protein
MNTKQHHELWETVALHSILDRKVFKLKTKFTKLCNKITNTKGYKVKLTLSNPAIIGNYMYYAVSLRNFNFHLHIHACLLHIR